MCPVYKKVFRVCLKALPKTGTVKPTLNYPLARQFLRLSLKAEGSSVSLCRPGFSRPVFHCWPFLMGSYVNPFIFSVHGQWQRTTSWIQGTQFAGSSVLLQEKSKKSFKSIISFPFWRFIFIYIVGINICMCVYNYNLLSMYSLHIHTHFYLLSHLTIFLKLTGFIIYKSINAFSYN